MISESILPPNVQIYHHSVPFELEQGGVLSNMQIAYHTYGQLNAERSNVIWVHHALTANSDVADWWPGMLGKGCLLDPSKHFIICVNVLGSIYGSTGPRSIDPNTDQPYGLDFPAITVRDVVRAQIILLKHLDIERIALCIGGSFGGHQALEMAIHLQGKIDQLVLLACSARETAWSIAIHESQRMAMETDPTFIENHAKAGENGMKTARAIGLISYRTIDAYIQTQTDPDSDKYSNYRACSYVRYQGDKLARRFHAHCYWILSKCLDSHHIGRARGPIEEVLQGITCPVTVIAMDGDMLIPPAQQEFLHHHLPHSTYHLVPTRYGHDGFLIEVNAISEILKKAMSQ